MYRSTVRAVLVEEVTSAGQVCALTPPTPLSTHTHTPPTLKVRHQCSHSSIMSPCSYLGEEVAQHSPALHFEPVTSCADVCACTLTPNGSHHGHDLIPLQPGASCSKLYGGWFMNTQVLHSSDCLPLKKNNNNNGWTDTLSWRKNAGSNHREPYNLTTETERHDCNAVGGWNTPALPPCQGFVWFEKLRRGPANSPTARTPTTICCLTRV